MRDGMRENEKEALVKLYNNNHHHPQSSHHHHRHITQTTQLTSLEQCNESFIFYAGFVCCCCCIRAHVTCVRAHEGKKIFMKKIKLREIIRIIGCF